MAAEADVGVLQDEVERILRRLTLEETRAVAEHLNIGDQADATKRDVLRNIQNFLDAAEDDDVRHGLLRGLPVPEQHRADYEQLLDPPPPPHAVENGGPDQGQIAHQVVPNVGQQNVAGLLPVDNTGIAAQPNLGDLQGNAQVALMNEVGLQPVNGALIAPQNLNNAGPVAQQNLGVLQFGNVGGANFINGVRPNNMVNVLGVAGQQNMGFGGGQQGVAANVVPNQVRHPVQNMNVGGANPNIVGQPLVNAGGGHVAHNPNGGVQNVAQIPLNAAQNQNVRGNPPMNFAGVPQNQNVLLPGQNVMNFPHQQRFVQFFPREFRMTGNISDDISKSMKYLDICRQVADGRNKGYRDDEILSGLRRVVSTGAVKTIIDSQSNAPLEEIMLFLRSFLKERTPAELHNDLSQMAQSESQTAISFFMEALQTRQLIVVGSQVEGTVSYDPVLVKSTFLHTIRTGLRDETVRAHMLPLLSDANPVDDNTLIRELHRAVGEAEERLKKLQEIQHQQKKNAAKVNVVETSPELAIVMKKLEESQAQIMENQNQMKVMQEQMAELMKKETGSRPPFKKPGCETCKAANKANSCRHCWKCGEDGHKSQECKKGK